MRLACRAPLLALTLLISACASPPGTTQADGIQQSQAGEIEAVVQTQAAAWNRGDIESFMQGYWRSPDLRFASGGTVTRGFERTLERYKARYSTRAAMGTLSFSELETVMLADDAAVLHGRWKLERDGDAPGGLVTLVFRKMNGEWVIISDTTTSGG
ncbi:MAG: DUF4440 domain-containing protein [Henriciella sp.]|jgi:ketosteroid isomerase-like protein|uniref:YybH family protein n=1 Tax=Henriciella sp. TaxID=1968823 RepID=UPI000C11B0A1|nr:nuclear transport factor 2 family protein [Henriciella sp.]MAN73467.1 DUF4440 domain-containing protein [Henriciella sp.]MBF34891.1 DUF4440 domain-containing protein [Hyphomonadaceae bacterium]PHR78768.1 MAG: DUF4440 domain-containing protein [Henriciella sp.]|tara:strand:+ start:2063 stop:2533 length:471 start_codon:yes stop_codon:yes gene_type:complete